MKNDPGWWSDWFIGLLVASGVLLIFKGGVAVTILLWLIYLGNGAKTVEAIPSQQNKQELATHTVIGVVVVIISLIITIAAHID